MVIFLKAARDVAASPWRSRDQAEVIDVSKGFMDAL
jgi:hypothetical protein